MTATPRNTQQGFVSREAAKQSHCAVLRLTSDNRFAEGRQDSSASHRSVCSLATSRDSHSVKHTEDYGMGMGKVGGEGATASLP